MKKINFDSSKVISIVTLLGTGAVALLKMVDDSKKAEKEKEEIVQEVIERLSKKD